MPRREALSKEQQARAGFDLSLVSHSPHLIFVGPAVPTKLLVGVRVGHEEEDAWKNAHRHHTNTSVPLHPKPGTANTGEQGNIYLSSSLPPNILRETHKQPHLF